jgi:protein CpxP
MRGHLIARAAPALLVAALLPPAGALAQTAPRNPAPPETAAPTAAAPQSEAAAPEQEAERAVLRRVERRIAELHAKLHITSAEESEWRQFADAMRDNARQIAPEFAERKQKFRSMNAVENMQSYAAIAEQHAKNMERLVPAFQNLYNSLSDAQKRTADAVWRNFAERASRRHRG